MSFSFRNANRHELARELQDARERSLALIEHFLRAGLDRPAVVAQTGTGSPLRELGHVAWFAEWFVLRDAHSSDPAAARHPSMLSRGDEWFGMHAATPPSDLPGSGATRMYAHEVLDRMLDKLSRSGDSDSALYPYRLALAHEDMWGERWMQVCQLLGLPLPPELAQEGIPAWAQGEIRFAGGTTDIGSAPGTGFVFDNEKWSHAVHVSAFSMDSTLVSNAQLAEFVEDGGYQHPEWWSAAGWSWRQSEGRSAPRHWRRDGRTWRELRFGREIVLAAHEPVRHVNLYEAQAWCQWAGRRLPSEFEWEYAALTGHPALRWGDLWEWTCSPFEPYPGFEADAWKGYSEPYFGEHQVLRGASFATPSRMRSARFRAFRAPQDDTLFAGFRSCVL